MRTCTPGIRTQIGASPLTRTKSHGLLMQLIHDARPRRDTGNPRTAPQRLTSALPQEDEDHTPHPGDASKGGERATAWRRWRWTPAAAGAARASSGPAGSRRARRTRSARRRASAPSTRSAPHWGRKPSKDERRWKGGEPPRDAATHPRPPGPRGPPSGPAGSQWRRSTPCLSGRREGAGTTRTSRRPRTAARRPSGMHATGPITCSYSSATTSTPSATPIRYSFSADVTAGSADRTAATTRPRPTRNWKRRHRPTTATGPRTRHEIPKDGRSWKPSKDERRRKGGESPRGPS